jgi:hypothetical protein
MDEVEVIDELQVQLSTQPILMLLQSIMSFGQAVGRQQHTILAWSIAS